jgi:hypothetical protein
MALSRSTVGAFLSVGVLAAAAAGAATGAWRVVASPNVGGERADDRLSAVSVVSASDVWAVGSSPHANGGSTLVEHWDGSAWTIVPSPNGSLAPSSLAA